MTHSPENIYQDMVKEMTTCRVVLRPTRNHQT